MTQTWIAVDLGDTEFILREFSDGAFVLEAPAGENGRIVFPGDAVARVAAGFVRLAIAQGWLPSPAAPAKTTRKKKKR